MEKESQTNPAHDRLEELQRNRHQRRRRRRWSAVITIFAILLLTGAVILILNDGASMLAGLLGDAPATGQTVQQDGGEYSTVTIAAVGDISISDKQLADARAGDGYDFSPGFLSVASLLGDADLTVGNLECSLSGEPYGSATSSAPEALVNTLAGLGVDLLQTANSTSIVGGLTGLESTLDALSRAGIDPVGTFRSAQEREDSGGVTLREVNGVRVAFIAFTKGLGNMSLPEDSRYAVNLLYSDYDTNYRNLDTDSIVAAMEAARGKNPDIIIALVHWGSENSREISISQERVKRLLYENGADAIIGTHSHMIGSIEPQTLTMESGAEKDVITAFDLGNFYTDSTRDGTQLSLVLRLEFTRNNATGQTALTGSSYTPVYCADFGPTAANRYQVLNAENAVLLYRQNYVYRIPDEMYQNLQQELSALPSRIAPPPEETAE